MIWVKVQRIDKTLPLPSYSTPGAAAIDLYSSYSGYINPGARVVVPTGIKIEMPSNCRGIIKSRSGLASKNCIDVKAGVIDSDYRGEVGVVLANNNNVEYFVRRGDKIAQMKLEESTQVVIKEVGSLGETQRGDGGYGSTGI